MVTFQQLHHALRRYDRMGGGIEERESYILTRRLKAAAALPDYEPWDVKTRPPRKKRHTAPPDGLYTASEAAAKLRCSTKTLAGHVALGALRYVQTGHGTRRPRRMFTEADLDAFIANQTRQDSPACASTKTRVRPTTSSTSNGEVIAFTARQNAQPSGKRRR